MESKKSLVSIHLGQIIAIKRTIKLAERLQQEHPEIAEMYRLGEFYAEIVRYLNLCETYGVTESIAKSATGLALRGYGGGKRFEGFKGLISDEEQKQLWEMHQKRHGYGLVAHKKGIHAQNNTTRLEATILGLAKQGKVPWKPREETEGYCRYSEQEYLFMLAKSQDYHHKTSKVKGKLDLWKIAKKINEIYHNGASVRNWVSVSCRVQQHKIFFSS